MLLVQEREKLFPAALLTHLTGGGVWGRRHLSVVCAVSHCYSSDSENHHPYLTPTQHLVCLKSHVNVLFLFGIKPLSRHRKKMLQ